MLSDNGRPVWRSRGNFIMFVLSILGALLLSGSAVSASEPLQVSADEYSLWDGSRLFVAQGHVTVHYNEALITADMLQYDADAGHALFLGNVFYSDNEQELTGESLHYDLNTGVALFDGMEAVLYSDGIKGPMFLSGQRVRATDGEVRMELATFTTCECTGDVPAYRFEAKELEIYPNDRIIVRKVTFYDHKVPLLYLPYLTLSLKEKTSRFDMPQVGYSERTGWYIKLTYNYVLKSGLYGAILFDYFQKLGPGGGVNHTYVDDDSGVGSVYVYGVGNDVGGVDGSFSWDRRWHGSPVDVRARYVYDVTTMSTGIAREQLLGRLTAEGRGSTGNFTARAEYGAEDRIEWLHPRSKLSGAVTVRQRFGNEWEVRLKGDGFDDRRNADRHRWFSYAGELRRNAPKYTLIARLEQQVNPDLQKDDYDRNPRWRYVSRSPEVIVNLRRMAGFDIGFGVVRLKEEPDGTMAWRGETEIGLATRTWRLSPAISFNGSGSARGRAYTTDDRQLTLQGRAGLNVRLFAPLSATLQYNYRDVWGDTPFNFDRVSPLETFAPRLNWRSSALTASLSTTYNMRTERWSVLSANATWRLTPNLVARGSGTYHVYDRTIERVAGTVDWKTSNESTVRLGAVYDVRRAAWSTMQADVQLKVGGGWEAGVTAIYNAARESFTRNHMYISHNACGCREIRLRYDQVKGEVWAEYHITAFPSSRIALGTGDDKLMFESDALADFLNQ